MDPERDIGNGSIKVYLGLMMTEKILVNGCCTCQRDKEKSLTLLLLFLIFFFFSFIFIFFILYKREPLITLVPISQ